MKLYSKLGQIEDFKTCVDNPECCSIDIQEPDVLLMDEVIVEADELISEHESAALYFIAGYIERKYNPHNITYSDLPESEFTGLVNRGKLTYPKEDLYQFIRLIYALFNLFDESQRFHCRIYVCKLFKHFYSTLPFTLIDCHQLETIVRTATNCFFKGVTKAEVASNIPPKSLHERKVRKLNT